MAKDAGDEHGARHTGRQECRGPNCRDAILSSARLHNGILRTADSRTGGALPDCHLQHLRQVQRMSVGHLLDLLATTESIGDDEPVRWGLVYLGDQDMLGTRDGS